MPQDKKEELIEDISHVLENKVNLLTVQSLMGKLNDIGVMCPFLKVFRHELNIELSKRIQEPLKLSNMTRATKRELLVWTGFLMDENVWIPINPPTHGPPILTLVFTSDAAGLPHACCYKYKIGVASIGTDNSDSLIAASPIWWEKSFIRDKRDEKGVRFGVKTTTLESIGLLLPFLTNPKMLVNKHILLRVDNMACVYGFENKNCTGDQNAAIFLQALDVIGASLGSKIYVEHAERRLGWTAEMADNMSREDTTSDLDMFTLNRFSSTLNIDLLSDWMKKPYPDRDLTMKLVDHVKTILNA